ncbi:MAG TPA: MFS transporter [Streptosporangiaceae bacterium]
MYPVYVLLFARTGLSAAEISSLFVIWSVTGFVLEVPSGVWADMISRRTLLALAPVLAGAGYALWTFLPSYPAFAAGFVLWGAGGALRSGTTQALGYEELRRLGATAAYARLAGRSEAASTVGQLVATWLAGPVLAAGGYQVVGLASVAASLLAAVVGLTLPESRAPRPAADTGRGRASWWPAYAGVLRRGLAEARRTPSIRRGLMVVAVLWGVSAVDEYVPLLVQATGVRPAWLTVLVGVVTAGYAVGGFVAGRGLRWVPPGLAAGACCLAAGALTGRPAGIVLVAAGFAAAQWAHAAAEARLQDHIGDDARATVTSLAGLGTEVVGIAVFSGYAVGSLWLGPGPLFALAAVPYLIVALVLRRT